MKRILILVILITLTADLSIAQTAKKDKGVFIENKNEFMDNIIKSTEKFKKKSENKKKTFKADFSNLNIPKSPADFKQFWHNPTINQGLTGTCWCYSGTSYLESEIFRINKTKVKISEMYTVYWEYIEKAKRWIKEHGESEFSEGSQGNAVMRIWKEYGCMPYKIYTGLQDGQEHNNHSELIKEMSEYLQYCKKNHIWDETTILNNIKAILNSYLGVPPEKFYYENKEYTPQTFRDMIAKLNLDEYVDVMSLMDIPYYRQGMYDVPDNWWKFDKYYNVPLDDYMNYLKSAVKDGFSAFIGGDVSEAGYWSQYQAAFVPSFDIPSELIDENARFFRYNNSSTTDDHGIHIVGYKEVDGKMWFLIKDSGSGSFNGISKGYYYYHEDYVKLKMMNFTVHKSALPEMIKKFIR
jgi:bleomycin hydrolase